MYGITFQYLNEISYVMLSKEDIRMAFHIHLKYVCTGIPIKSFREYIPSGYGFQKQYIHQKKLPQFQHFLAQLGLTELLGTFPHRCL